MRDTALLDAGQRAASGDDSRETLLNLALAEARSGDVAAARARLLGLEAREPDWSEPPLRLAESLKAPAAARPADIPAAMAAYERALDREPARREALLGLAVLHIGAGAPERAQALLLRCCAAHRDCWQTWDALGVALRMTGDAAAAESAFGRAHSLAPDNLPILLRLGGAALRAGHAEAELARLETAALRDPLDAATLAARGALLADMGRLDEALAALEAAVALAPDDAAFARLLAATLVRADRPGEAVPLLEGRLARDPDDAATRADLVTQLVRVHRVREARDHLDRLLAAHGEQPGLLCSLAGVLVCLGEQSAGVAAARRATILDPDSHFARRTLANAASYADGVDGATVLALLRDAGARAPRGAVPPWRPPTPRGPTKRLRVGLLSYMLRTHPVGWLSIAGLENLDPAGFELVCIAQPESADPMQRRFRAIASEWHVAAPAEQPGAVAAQARALDLDILIDLGGYSDRGMLAACAERLAPVQVKWVGMQTHTTGLAEMDWFVTDRWETPPGLAPLYSERLLTMPDGYACYAPPTYAPAVATLPAASRGHVTFGCFNNLAKITPGTLALWARVLDATPGARLVLKTHQFSDPPTVAAMRARLAASGIEPARVTVRGASPHARLLAEYADIDIVLDPHPYSGGLTTCEALWMGVPVVTLPGETFAARHSMSHLCNVGLADWVAADTDDYVAIARGRAADPVALAELRARLRPTMRASPLCDGPRFGRHLGRALRDIWREGCAPAPPA